MKCKAKKILTLLLSVMLLLSTVSTNVFALEYGSEWAGYEDSEDQVFSDVPKSHWAYEAISRASSKTWFGGYPDGNFKPNNSITRAEALKVFVMFLGLDYKSVDLSDLTYSDVYASDWYAPYIEAGKDLFPVHTTIQGKTPFNPNMPVTREDTIYALVKALGCDVNEKYPDQSVLNMFKDANSISGNIKSIFSIALMPEHQLVSGFPDGTIRAQAALTRAEFATLLIRGTEHGHHDVYQAKITGVTVSPASPVEIEIGESITLSARATYTDGTNQAYSSLQPYDAENNGVISLAGTTITGLKEGTTTIKYNDSYLKKDSLTVIVKKPTSKLAIKLYEYPEQTELSKVTVLGEVIDADVSSVNLAVNSKDIKVNADGSFAVDVSLKVGTNELKFVAVNKYNDTAERTISIVRADVPEIRITDYKERTSAKTTPVSGVVNYYDLNNIKVDCNGTPITVNADGTFTITVDLKVGKNPFLFKGTTSSGNTAEQAIVIRRYEIIEEPEPTPEPKPIEEVYVWDWMDAIPSTEQYKRVEAVMVIDDSGSMDWTDTSNKRLEVAREFIDSSNENTKIGIVKFDNTSQIVTSRLIQCNDSGKNTLKDYLNFGNGIFDSYGTTYMYTGINDAFSIYESNDSDVMKVMIVLSDGDAHDTHIHAQTMLEASNKNIAIYTVGLDDSGSYSDYFDAYLKPLALSTGGAFYLADDADKLADIFQKIFVLIDTKTDSDGDGISDYYEDTIKDKNNKPIKMDKNSLDTDGDSLSDGEEISLKFEYNSDQTKVRVTAYMTSNPTMVDTDGDSVSDKDDNYPLDANNK